MTRLKERLSRYLEAANAATKGPWQERIWSGGLEWPEGKCATLFGHGPPHKYEPSDNLQAVSDATFIALSRDLGPFAAKHLLRAIALLEWQVGSEHIGNTKMVFEAREFLRGLDAEGG